MIQKHNILQSAIWLLTLIALFYAKEFYLSQENYSDVSMRGVMPLALLMNGFMSATEGLNELITILLVSANSILLTRIVVRNIVFTSRIHIIILVYFTICSTIPAIPTRYISYLIATLTLISWEYIFGIYKNPKAAYRLYIGAAIMALSSLLYAPAIIFIIPLLGCCIMFERSNIKDYITIILGFATPILFYGYLSWLGGGELLLPYKQLYESITSLKTFTSIDLNDLSHAQIGYMILLTIMMAYAMVFNIRRRLLQRAKSVRSYQLILLMLMFLLTMISIAPMQFQSLMPLLVIPVTTIICPMLIKHKSKKFVNLLYILLMAGALLINIEDIFTTSI